jgi:predicted amidohydrolase YtcJ
MVLVGGVIPTVPEAQALALGGERILAIGRDEEIRALCSDATRVIELQGRAVLPGFVDAHTHFLGTGLERIGARISLSGLSRDETLSRLMRAAADRGGGDWIIGRGWDESLWSDRIALRSTELDRVTMDHPLLAVRLDGHLLVANRAAAKRIPAVLGRPAIEIPEGVLREEPAFSLLEALTPDADTLREALHSAVETAHALGVTSIHTMLRPRRMAVYLRERRRLGLRVALYPEAEGLDALETLGVATGFGDDAVRIGGVKLFADGSVGAGNAAVARPYNDSGELGALNYPREAIVDFLRRAEAAGLQTAIHAIGDRAIDQVLEAHAAVHTSAALRHRIEHFELASPAQVRRAAELSLNLSMQPNFVANWSGDGGMYEARLGASRDRRIDPHRWVLDEGLPLAFGSDSMPFSPLIGLHAAVNAPHPAQRVSVEEGIACYTRGGAYLSFEEADKGSLHAGALADLVVLDDDPRKSPDRIRERRVEMTVLGGRIVYTGEG